MARSRPTPVSAASNPGTPRVEAGDGVLRIAGTLSRDSVPALWKRALPLLAGITAIDLHGVTDLDSEGVALLAELAARAGHPAIRGEPAGLSELRTAYRLTQQLDFSTSD